MLIPNLLILISMLISGCGKNQKLFVAGYTRNPDDKGFSVYELKTDRGELIRLTACDAGPNPSYFTCSPGKNLFYIINEVGKFKGNPGGGLTTLKYDEKSGELTKQHEMNVPNGGPCYISLSPDGGYLLIANYSRGSVAVVRLDQSGIPESVTDTIFYIRDPSDRSHAHMISADPAGKKIYVTDLALDKILIYDFDNITGRLAPSAYPHVQLPEGEGPRHFVFSPDGSKLYVINELGSTVMVFDVTDQRAPQLVQTLSTVREDFEGRNFCADIHIGKNGKFLYGSNRGENTIVTFSIGSDGLLSLAGHTSCGGDWPRNFVIDPSGTFLLVGNQRSDNISVFRINSKTGLPEEQTSRTESVSPACLKFY